MASIHLTMQSFMSDKLKQKKNLPDVCGWEMFMPSAIHLVVIATYIFIFDLHLT